MRFAALAHLLHDPTDERCGSWSQEELEQMNARFAERLEEAFRLGLESRASTANQVRLPTNSGPRFVAPRPPDGLLRSTAGDALLFVARG